VQHHLAACSGDGVPARASDAYVTQVFDSFAASFDAKLAKLHYRAPEAVTEALRRVLPAPARQLAIADLGCGTGLCGPLLAAWAQRLVGCDLSAAMLELARQRGVYDELEKAELLQYLQAHVCAFDVLVSADTLVYFGVLEDVSKAARRALTPGGHFVFSVEALPEADAADYRLLGHGRYAHSRGYLESTLAAAGLQRLAIDAEVLREEAGRPVHGWVVSATRPVSEQ
ncbi:MAG: methyltransferase domain-containing protein, partial [Pseudomonadota bacterium]|nr:methyltransferase domain-containing protein [Pseudomonadota bacterium]